MANRYWVGGAGTWDTTTTTHWSTYSGGPGGASAPTATDSVFFDQAGSYTVSLTGTVSCLDITTSTGTVALGNTGSLSVNGSLNFNTGTTWTTSGSLSFVATTTGQTVTTNGCIFGAINFNGLGGQWILGSALTTSSGKTTTLTAGTLTLNGYDLTTGTFASNNTNTRSIAFGSNNIIMNIGTAAQTVLSMATATNFTCTGTGGFVTDAGLTRTCSFGTTGGSVTNAPNLTLTGSGTGIVTLTTGSWFNKLDFGTTAFALASTSLNINSLTLSTGGTFTNMSATMVGTGTITPNGKTISALNINSTSGTTTLAGALGCSTYTQTSGNIDFGTFNLTCSSTANYTSGTISNIGTITCTTWTCGSTFTLTSGTITPTTSFVVTGGFNYNGGTLSAVPTFTHTSGTVTFNRAYALTATGTYTLTAGTLTLNGYDLTTGTFVSSGSSARNIAFGSNNIILSTTTAGATVLSMTNATNFTLTGTGGFVSDLSTTRTFVFGTTGGSAANAPNLTLTGSGGNAVTITTGSWFNKLDFGTNPTTIGSTALNINNNLVLSSGGNFLNLSVTMIGTGTITPNGASINALTINSTSGTTTLAGALSCTTYTQTSGNIDFGTFNLSCSGAASYTSGTISNIGTITCTTWTCAGTFTLTSGTITPSTSFVVTGGFNYNGGTLSAVPTFTHTSGNVTFSKAYALTATGTYTLTAGNLTLNGFDLTTGIFSSAVSGTRSIAFGTNNIILAHTTAAQTVLLMTVATGFTCTGTGGFVTDASVTRTVRFGTTGGSSDIAPNLTLTGSGTGVITLTTGSWFNKLDFGTTAFAVATTTLNVNSLTLSTGGTFTALTVTSVGTGTITTNGKTITTFNINSASGTTTVNAPITCSGAASYTSGTLNNNSTITCTNWTCTGTFTMTNGTITPSGAFIVIGGFNYNGGTLSAVATFTHTAGTVTLGKAYALTATGTYTLTSGTLDLSAGFNLSTGIFSTSNPNARSIVFGSGNIILTHTTAATTVLDGGSAGGFTCTGTGGFTTDASITRTLRFGDVIALDVGANAPNLALTGSGTSVITLNSSSYFGKLDFGTTTFALPLATLYLSGLTLSSGGTFTLLSATMFGTGTITPNGKSIAALNINSTSGTTTLAGSLITGATSTSTLVSGTLNLNNFNLSAGTFSSTGTLTRSIAFGSGNIILIHTTDTATVLDMGDATNFTYTGTGGFTADASLSRSYGFGSSAGGSSTNAPNLTITGSGNGAVTFTNGSWFNKLDFGTTTFILGNGTSVTLYLNSLTMSASGTFTGLTAYMVGTGTITPNGQTIASLTVDSVSGTTTLAGALTVPAGITTTLNSGTLNLNNFNLTTGTFSSTGTLTRSIAFGSGNIVLSTTTAGTTNVDITDATNFTCSGTGGFTTNLSTTRTFTIGTTNGSAAGAPNLSLTSGSSVPTLTTGSWFGKLDFTGTTSTPASTIVNVDTLTLATGGTYTGLTPIFTRTQTWTSQFSKQLNGIGVNGSGVTLTLDNTQTYTATATCYVTQGTLNLGGYDLTIGTLSSNNTNTRSIAFGTNNIILSTTTTGVTNLDMADATGFTCSGTGGFTADCARTRTYTFGSTAGGTSTNSPKLSLTGSGTSVATFTANSWFNTLNFGTTAFNTGSQQVNVNNLTLSTGGTFTSLTPTMVGTGTITTNGKTISAWLINSTSGTTTLAGNVTTGTTLGTYFASGTLDLGGFTLTTGFFNSVGTNSRSIVFGSGNIILTHTTAGTTVLNIPDATGFTCTGTGGFTADASITRTYTVGSTAGGSSSNAPNLTLTGSGTGIATFTSGSWFNKLDFGTTAFAVTPPTLNVNSLTLSTGGTFTNMSVTMVGTGTITPNGRSIAALNINSTSGTTTLAGALGCSTYTQTSGNIDFATFNLTCSSAASYTSGTLNNTGIIRCTTWTCTGTFTMTNGTITPSSSFVVTGGFNYNGGTLSAVPTFTHTSGNVTFNQAYALTTYTLTAGNLTLNGFDLTTGIFASNNTNTRSIAFGSNNIIMNIGAPGQTVLSMAFATNFTWTGTGGFVTDAGLTRTCSFGSSTGGSTSNAPNLTLTGSGTGVITLTTGSWFNKLDFGTTAFAVATTTLNVNSLTLSSGGTFTNMSVTLVGTGTITPNGKSIAALNINSTSGTTTLAGALTVYTSGVTTLTSGTLDLGGFTLTTGAFASNNTNTRSIVFGSGNIVLATTAAGTNILSMADATNFSYTGTPSFTTTMSVTRAFSFGSTAGGSASNAPNLSLTSGASIPTITSGSWFGKLDFTGTTSTPAITAINVDTLTLATGGTYTGLTPIFTRTQTWTPQFSKQLNGIGVNGSGVTLTLNNTQTYTAGSTLYVNGGTLNLNSTSQTFGYFASSTTGSRSITGGGTGSITISNDWTVTTGSGFTGTDYKIIMNKSTSKTFAGGGGQYGTLTQTGAGPLSITGSNSFADIKVV